MSSRKAIRPASESRLVLLLPLEEWCGRPIIFPDVLVKVARGIGPQKEAVCPLTPCCAAALVVVRVGVGFLVWTTLRRTPSPGPPPLEQMKWGFEGWGLEGWEPGRVGWGAQNFALFFVSLWVSSRGILDFLSGNRKHVERVSAHGSLVTKNPS